jgi:hypothetical protein
LNPPSTNIQPLLVKLCDIVAIMFLRSAVLSLSALVVAKEMPKDDMKAAQLYDSGIKHNNNMALKMVCGGFP